MSDELRECTLPIASIAMPGGAACWRVGKDGITRIEATAQMGQNGWVPWFSVFSEGRLFCVINAAFIALVEYAPLLDET